MFGTWRLLLAILVVFAHLSAEHASFAWVGTYAVQAFFILSGYLMTLILQEKYGFTLAGFQRFVVNRFLRIYPSYYAALACSLLCLLVFGSTFVTAFHPQMRWPQNWSEWWPNLTILGLTNAHPVRFVPPAWALDIELVFYLLLAVVLGRSRRIALAWLVVSLALFAFRSSLKELEVPGFRYLANSLPFALGSMVYHGRKLTPHGFVWKPWMISACCLMWVGAFTSNFLQITDPYSKAFSVNLAASALMVWGLSQIRVERNSFWAKFDKRCGDLSYPVYLLHWQCAVACAFLLPITDKGPVTFAVVLLATILLAEIEVLCLSGPIENFRHRNEKIAK